MLIEGHGRACWGARNGLFLDLDYTGVYSCKILLTFKNYGLNCRPIMLQ